jgi:DNA primase
MSTPDWSRVVRKGRAKTQADADSIPIEAIIAFYGGEIRQGKSASVKCCIHDDSRRSAVMNTYDNLYYCHTCGKGGTGVQVVMEKEGLDFKDALKRATEIAASGGYEVRTKFGRSNRKVLRRSWDIS